MMRRFLLMAIVVAMLAVAAGPSPEVFTARVVQISNVDRQDLIVRFEQETLDRHGQPQGYFLEQALARDLGPVLWHALNVPVTATILDTAQGPRIVDLRLAFTPWYLR